MLLFFNFYFFYIEIIDVKRNIIMFLKKIKKKFDRILSYFSELKFKYNYLHNLIDDIKNDKKILIRNNRGRYHITRNYDDIIIYLKNDIYFCYVNRLIDDYSFLIKSTDDFKDAEALFSELYYFLKRCE